MDFFWFWNTQKLSCPNGRVKSHDIKRKVILKYLSRNEPASFFGSSGFFGKEGLDSRPKSQGLRGRAVNSPLVPP